VGAVVVAAFVGVARFVAAGDAPDFNREIRPILSRNCFACHGPDEHDRRGGLRLDDRAAATSELESGLTAIVPGKPAESELVARIRTTDADIVMPPPESNHVLSVAQKDLLERWIAAGAPYAAHWAYVPPAAAAEPAGSSKAAGGPATFRRLDLAHLRRPAAR
jgi:mono/diheme cytochrome c family protein